MSEPTATLPIPARQKPRQEALALTGLPEQGAEFLSRISAAKRFTGSQLAEDWERALCITAAVVAGLDLRTVAAGHDCSVNVISHVVAIVSQHDPSVVTALKTRTAARLQVLTAVLTTSLMEDVVNGWLKPEHKPVALGIAAANAALWSGDATQRIEVSGPDLEGLRTAAKRLIDLPTESVSVVSESQVAVVQPVVHPGKPSDTAADTAAMPLGGSPGLCPADLAPVAPIDPQPAGRGGGSEAAGPDVVSTSLGARDLDQGASSTAASTSEEVHP